MKVLLFLALLGSALAFQGPVEYTYEYRARVGTGVQSSRPQFAATGLKATVKLSIQQEGEGYIEVSDVKVGEKNQVLASDGRQEVEIDYKPIQDKSLEEPFKAHFRRKDGETVMEVPSSDLLWVTNVRRGIVNFFRVAPLIEPSSVRPPITPTGEAKPQAFSRIEDTYAGRCRVSYSLSPASVYDIPRPIREDIQSKQARKGSAGDQIKLDEKMYSLKTSIDFSTCSDRVVLMQTGAGNLTNVTSSSFKDVATRTYFSQHILKGSPGKFRVESGVVESEYIMNPFGVESDKMIIISNQTVALQAARPLSSSHRASPSLKPVHTWRHQIQSPNSKPSGYSPRWILYKKENEQGYSPIFYERLVSGFGWPSSTHEKFRHEVRDALKRAADRLDRQNKESTEEPRGYSGSDDGRAAQELQHAHKVIRTFTKDQITKLDTEMEQIGSSVARDLYHETLAIAGSGPALDVLLEKIQSGKISENRTASIFFTMTNNIQSPETVEKMISFVKTLHEEERVTVSLLSKINLASVIRRLCVSPSIRVQSHMHYAFGDKMCNRQKVIQDYLPHLESRITSSPTPWVKILNIIAAGNLGARESLDVLERVARGEVSPDIFVRFAAIHSMGFQSFDKSSQDRIFNILQPIAESQAEDYRVRQVAYNSLLSWKPNVTFIQRMAMLSNTEPSIQIQSFIYWVIGSLARIEDPEYKPISLAAQNLLPVTRYMNPSSSRSMSYTTSRYVYGDRIGASANVAWLTQLKESFPRELYTYIVGKFGNMEVPLIETVTFGNTSPAFSKLFNAVKDFTKPRKQIHSQLHEPTDEEPDIYYYIKLFRNSEAFLPMTSKIYEMLKRSATPMDNKPERVISYKYLNPVESNVIMPSPVGLFFHIEMNTPTVMYSNMMVQSYSNPDHRSDHRLPSLQRINIKAEGIAKLVTKINAYSYVLAPWTKKTVMAAIDNEKSVSLPMKYEAEADLRNPAQIFWGKITPQFKSTQDRIPVMKVRNMPFTAVGGLLPSPAVGKDIKEYRQVRWVYSSEQESRVTYQVSEENTGLNAEISYKGEALPPFYQHNLYKYLIDEPSRLLNLLASPSIKGYDMTLYRKPGTPRTKSIGFALRYLEQDGAKNSASPPMSVQESANRPVDVSPEDSQSQRENKLKAFSDHLNMEYSAQVNFTGGEVKKYEASIIYASENRSVSDAHNMDHVFHKLQFSWVEKNSQSKRKQRTCLVSAYERPQLRATATVRDLSEAHKREALDSAIALDVFEGDSCSSSAQPLFKSLTNLTVSETRVKAIMNVTNDDDLLYNSTHEFYRLAVYDHVLVEGSWGTPSDQLKNITLRVRDLVEGYLFPKLVKNYLSPGSDKKIVVRADRSISDDRVDAYVEVPEATVSAERINVSPLFDMISGFTPDVLTTPSPSAVISAVAPGDKCIVLPAHVRTFDGVSYQKPSTGCWIVAMKMKDNEVEVLTRQTTSGVQQIKIKHEDVELLIDGQDVKINGQPMSGQSKDIHSRRGVLLAKIVRKQSSIELSVPGLMELEMRENHKMMIKLDSSSKNSVMGLCGNFNGEPSDDLEDDKECFYGSSMGREYATAWVLQKSECHEPSMTPLFDATRHYQSHCSKDHQALSQTNTPCRLRAYPITEFQSSLCVSTVPEPVCATGCVATTERTETVQNKCWPESSAPQTVINHKEDGYVMEPVTSPAHEMKPITLRLPNDCRPIGSLGSSSNECYIHPAYAVHRAGPLLCVTRQSVTQCQATCNIQDTIPTRVPGKCWNEDKAPIAVRQAVRLGYTTSPVTDAPQFIQDMYVHVPRQCSKPINN